MELGEAFISLSYKNDEGDNAIMIAIERGAFLLSIHEDNLEAEALRQSIIRNRENRRPEFS